MSGPPITEADLRAAMRDPRYWQAGHPERSSYVARVSEGWRSLVEAEAGQGGAVNVRPYVRTISGKAVNVAAHTRGDPPGGSGSLSGQEMPAGRVPDRIVAAAYRRSAACDAQFERDRAICRTLPLPAIRRSCWTSAMERYAQCGRGGYIPPLNTGR
jgi:hypothetical protein